MGTTAARPNVSFVGHLSAYHSLFVTIASAILCGTSRPGQRQSSRRLLSGGSTSRRRPKFPGDCEVIQIKSGTAIPETTRRSAPSLNHFANFHCGQGVTRRREQTIFIFPVKGAGTISVIGHGLYDERLVMPGQSLCTRFSFSSGTQV